MIEHDTDTSKWAIAIHRVSTTTAEVWVGTLFPTMAMPKRARVRLWLPGGKVRTTIIQKNQWKRPFRKTKQRFWSVVTFKNLQPNTDYKVQFHRFVEAKGDVIDSGWQHLRSGYFDTLPKRIPTTSQKPFTIGLGSCYYDHRDGGQAAGAYQALYERGPEKVRPDITFLTGDQVYLDIGFDSLSRNPDEIRQRIADDYAQHWRSLGGILNRGGTWMMPDDHEYWNDYPFHDSLIPQLLALKFDKVRAAWSGASKDAVKNIQRSPIVEIMSIGHDLSICLADLRSHRSDKLFLPNAQFAKIVDWAENLTCPGVFVILQPLIVKTNKTERNLRSFKSQYARLIQALGASGHDIVLFSGDVHFGRIARCNIGPNGGRLIEIVSSPLSNLTFLNGIATSIADHVPKKFPEKGIDIPGWQPQTVTYTKEFDVSTSKGRIFSAYPKARTREHFMTVSFQRPAGGGLRLTANAWRVRERHGPKNLPKRDFAKPYTIDLA
jgi:hypothetical protein